MSSRRAINNESAIEENIKKQKELEKKLDDGEIDLDEFRRQQTPLRQEFAELKKQQGAKPSPEPSIGLDATGRPRKGMVERDEKGKIKFDSQAFLAEQDAKRRARMSELGFTDDEINTLLGPSSSSNGVRSRTDSGMRSLNSSGAKYADEIGRAHV